jgi:hypothetical protein
LGGRAIQALLHEHEGSSTALLGVIETHVAGFEKQNCAMALNRCVKAAVPVASIETCFHHTYIASPHIVSSHLNIDGPPMARLSKAALAERARTAVAKHPATQRLVERTGMLLHTFNSIELSNTINGLSKLGRHPGSVFMQAFTEAVSAALWTFNPQVRRLFAFGTV